MPYDLHIEYANPDEEYAPEAIPLEQYILTIPGPRQLLPLKIMNCFGPETSTR